MVTPASDALSFRDLVFSDYARYRPGARQGWLHVLLRVPSVPGLLASLLLRSQQCLFRSGHVTAAHSLRTLGNVLVGADFGAGMQVGRGFMLAHPVGVTIGFGLVIGDDVTFAGGVTCAARHYDARPGREQEFATIGDGVLIGANAVLVGGVTIGRNAVVGANSVVLSDVPEDAVVMGSPARRVGTREDAS
ncbi:serine O-acetyltransferase [Aeromicrobium sp. CFBP 8757]|uniref:serine O-acetyltransferase n=1 Tax=Aeromicrobium sp. CFBP 8757 TaxID=2775288 RepID=UPI003530494C